MNTLALLSAIAWEGWQGILFKIVVVCILIWAINELIKWMGWAIPRPIQIVAIALACILVIYWLFQLFNLLV